MPFPLPDLKRSYGRSGSRGGSPDVRPYLLIGRELNDQRSRLADAIEWFSHHVGRPRSAVSADDLAQRVGDYRLARCLASCLQSTFSFSPPPFERAVERLLNGESRSVWHRLQEVGAGSASALRLYVFDAISRRHGGFVEPQARNAALTEVSEPLGCTAEQLDALLWCDAEAHEVLSLS